LEAILVTGCGGDVALSAGRVLRDAGVASRLIGCDASSDHPGRSVFDECVLVPRADALDYPERLREVCERVRAKLVLPMSEPELARLLREKALEALGGVPVLAANAKSVETGLDKLATSRLLAGAGLAHPWTEVVGEGRPRSLPCMIKKRTGSGGRGLGVVADEKGAAVLAEARKGDLWQELLLPADEEYTCGLFRSAGGEIRTLSLRRTLMGEFTAKAEVRSVPAIDEYLRAIAAALDLRGCVNAQLRLTPRGPVVFEINPRLSSTVAFRHRLGFRDLLWAIEDRLGRPLSSYRAPKEGARVYRTYGEYLPEPEENR